MSVNPGATLVKDPNADLVYTWDWSDWLVGGATIATSTFTIDDPALVSDNESIVAGSVSTRHRLTGGTLGAVYTVTNRIITNETPAQTDDRSIRIRILST